MGVKGWWVLAVALWGLGGLGWLYVLSAHSAVTSAVVHSGAVELSRPSVSGVLPASVVSVALASPVALPPGVRCVGGFQVRVSHADGVAVFDQVLSAGKPATCVP